MACDSPTTDRLLTCLHRGIKSAVSYIKSCPCVARNSALCIWPFCIARECHVCVSQMIMWCLQGLSWHTLHQGCGQDSVWSPQGMLHHGPCCSNLQYVCLDAQWPFDYPPSRPVQMQFMLLLYAMLSMLGGCPEHSLCPSHLVVDEQVTRYTSATTGA